MTTSSEIRRRRERRRVVGLWLILLGVVALSLAAVVLLALELVGCGTVVAPAPWPPGAMAQACAAELARQALVGSLAILAGVILLASGIAVRALTPKPLGF